MNIPGHEVLRRLEAGAQLFAEHNLARVLSFHNRTKNTFYRQSPEK
jgi:hypothetical protein